MDKLDFFLKSNSRQELFEMEKDYEISHKCISFDNPISIILQDTLNEGLIHTYPFEKTVEYIKKYFQLNNQQIDIEQGMNGSKVIVVYVPVINNNVEEINKAFNLCGYFLSYPKEDVLKTQKGKWVILQYEPKHSEKITSFVRWSEKILYHITPLNKKNKIKKNGITPKTNNNIFNYPDRIYLMSGKCNKYDIFTFCKTLMKTKDINSKGCCLITINVELIPDNVDFFFDPYFENAFFTKENVPPSAIEGIEEVIF